MPIERFVVVSGLSGAGKTTALHALEELGYYTTDNLPPGLFGPLLQCCLEQEQPLVAVVVDARTRHFLHDLPAALERSGAFREPEIVFLEADDETLIRRYGLTRRTHPLREPTLVADLREERRVLADVRARAGTIIDTTSLTARSLLERFGALFGSGGGPILRLYSFGFKHGAPRDADLVLDVRGMPNPYYDPDLEPLSGLDPRVREHVFSPEAVGFYFEVENFLESSLEMAQRAGRKSYTVAVGCTGGRHRSVAVVESLARDINSAWRVAVEHRDIALAEGGP
ncbi:MAG TPA: RNase adapter RapZ [Deinococcales bacterium]|nr:RNase adapter RapZ [Deinococcales bacterium]